MKKVIGRGMLWLLNIISLSLLGWGIYTAGWYYLAGFAICVCFAALYALALWWSKK